MQPRKFPRYMTIGQVRTALKVTARQVDKWLNAGLLTVRTDYKGDIWIASASLRNVVDGNSWARAVSPDDDWIPEGVTRHDWRQQAAGRDPEDTARLDTANGARGHKQTATVERTLQVPRRNGTTGRYIATLLHDQYRTVDPGPAPTIPDQTPPAVPLTPRGLALPPETVEQIDDLLRAHSDHWTADAAELGHILTAIENHLQAVDDPAIQAQLRHLADQIADLDEFEAVLGEQEPDDECVIEVTVNGQDIEIVYVDDPGDDRPLWQQEHMPETWEYDTEPVPPENSLSPAVAGHLSPSRGTDTAPECANPACHNRPAGRKTRCEPCDKYRRRNRRERPARLINRRQHQKGA